MTGRRKKKQEPVIIKTLKMFTVGHIGLCQRAGRSLWIKNK